MKILKLALHLFLSIGIIMPCLEASAPTRGRGKGQPAAPKQQPFSEVRIVPYYIFSREMNVILKPSAQGVLHLITARPSSAAMSPSVLKDIMLEKNGLEAQGAQEESFRTGSAQGLNDVVVYFIKVKPRPIAELQEFGLAYAGLKRLAAQNNGGDVLEALGNQLFMNIQAREGLQPKIVAAPKRRSAAPLYAASGSRSASAASASEEAGSEKTGYGDRSAGEDAGVGAGGGARAGTYVAKAIPKAASLDVLLGHATKLFEPIDKTGGSMDLDSFLNATETIKNQANGLINDIIDRVGELSPKRIQDYTRADTKLNDDLLRVAVFCNNILVNLYAFTQTVKSMSPSLRARIIAASDFYSALAINLITALAQKGIESSGLSVETFSLHAKNINEALS